MPQEHSSPPLRPPRSEFSNPPPASRSAHVPPAAPPLAPVLHFPTSLGGLPVLFHGAWQSSF